MGEGVGSHFQHYVIEIVIVVETCIFKGKCPCLQICLSLAGWGDVFGMLIDGALIPLAVSRFIGERRYILLSLSIGQGKGYIVTVIVTTRNIVFHTHECKVVVDGDGTAEIAVSRIHGSP